MSYDAQETFYHRDSINIIYIPATRVTMYGKHNSPQHTDTQIHTLFGVCAHVIISRSNVQYSLLQTEPPSDISRCLSAILHYTHVT